MTLNAFSMDVGSCQPKYQFVEEGIGRLKFKLLAHLRGK